MQAAKKIIIFSLCFAASFLPLIVRADTIFNLAVTPAVIDIPSCEKGRICLEKNIAIKNNSSVRADVYAQVNDLSPDNGLIQYSDPSDLPADASLVRWIDFYRSVIEIMPGETATETLRITASPDAHPGTYHAIISFPVGGSLPEAQAIDQKLNQARVQINLNLIEHQVEQAEINQFLPVKTLFTKNKISFILKIKNVGNRPVAPAGEIIIYNKGGQEVGSLPIAGATIASNEIKDLSVAGNLPLGPGKFKAVLDLDYGENNGKNLTDIVYFSYLPLVWFIIILVIILAALYGAALFIQKKRQGKKPAPVEAVDNQPSYDSRPSHLKHPKYLINLKK